MINVRKMLTYKTGKEDPEPDDCENLLVEEVYR